MSEAKHTPGPWLIEPDHIDDDGAYSEPSIWSTPDDSGKQFAIATIRIGLLGSAANAHLIAAAPELLEACKEMVRRFTGLFDSYARKTYAEGSNPDSDLELSLINAKSAIQKADNIKRVEGQS